MSDNKPNILLFVVDCLRADRAYGRVGNPKVPVQQGFMKKGTTFSTAISSATNTTPSFASLLSSLFGYNHGVRSLRGYRMADTFPTLPEVLKEAGYHTYAEVSGPLREENRLNRGFDEYVYREKGMGLFSTFLPHLKRRISEEYRQPWFMMLHLWSLHRPRKIKRGWKTKEYGDTIYDQSLSSLDEKIGELMKAVPENTIMAYTGDHGERMNDGDNDPENHRIAARFPAMENFFENFHHKSKRRRQRHAKREGEEIGPLGGACHGFHVYEDLCRVPMIFTGPGVPKNLEIDSLVRHVDIGPTLLELAGVDAPEDFGSDGRSLVPLMKGESVEAAPAYLEATGQNLKSPTRWVACIRTEKLKYMRGLLDENMPEELYDIVEDPEETTNLAPDDPRIEEMRKLFTEMAGDAAVGDIDTSLSKDEMDKLDDTLRALGYID